MKYNKINVVEKNRYFIIIEITRNEKSLIIGCFYISPALCDKICDEILEQCLYDLTKFINLPVIIIGDLNARFGELNQIPEEAPDLPNENLTKKRQSNDAVLNKRGTLMCETFEIFGYTMLNGRSIKDTPAKFTYVGAQGKSVIDVAWANDSALTFTTNFEILYSSPVSDHFPCVVNIKTDYGKRPQKRPTENNRRIIWNQQQTNNYKTSLNLLHENPAITPSITEIVQHINNTAKDLGMEKYAKSERSRLTNPWYNYECGKMKAQVRKAANEFKKNNLNSDKLEIYRKLRNNYTNLIRKCKNDYEIQLKTKLANVQDNVTFWKTIKEITPKNTVDNYISIAEWQQHLTNIQEIPPTNDKFASSTIIEDEFLDRPIEISEIKRSIGKLNPKKALALMEYQTNS
jgi:hypothetical protein